LQSYLYTKISKVIVKDDDDDDDDDDDYYVQKTDSIECGSVVVSAY
jgi:hypothetical protein